MQQGNVIDPNGSFFIRAHCDDVLRMYNRENDVQYILRSFEVELLSDIPVSVAVYYKLTCICNRNDSNRQKQHSSNLPRNPVNTLSSNEPSQVPTLNPDKYITLSFIIKKAPYDNEHDNKQHAYIRDARMFCGLIPLLSASSLERWVPHDFVCGSEFVVLQDIMAKGYKPTCLHSDSFKDLEILPILKSLAYIHTASLIYELGEDSITEHFSQYFGTSPIAMDNPWFTVGLTTLVELAKLHPKYKTVAERHFLETNLKESLQVVCDMVKPSCTYKNTLLLRSIWEGHVFLNVSNPGAAAIFMEFNNCTYGPPAIDVIYTLYANVTPELLLEKEQFYLSYYFDHFRTNLYHNNSCEDAIPFKEKEFRKSFEEFRLLGMIYRALNATIVLVPSDIVDDVYKYQNRSNKLFECMYHNRELRETLFTYVEEITDKVMPSYCSEIDASSAMDLTSEIITTNGL